RFSVMREGLCGFSSALDRGFSGGLFLRVVTKLAPVGARRLRWEVHICLSTGQTLNRFSF
ncbi:hypothetical protein, partial [Escherichia coli]|uniref:hypothetical protein n=1 Tax=Escherichia coli TaxID=562 RepID=UPI001BC8B7E2